MKNLVSKLSTQAKVVSGIFSAVILMCGIAYSVATFIEHGNQCYIELQTLKDEFHTYKRTATEKHHKLSQKVIDSENDFKLTAAKLDTSLARIATDLQFIKEQLMSRGMK